MSGSRLVRASLGGLAALALLILGEPGMASNFSGANGRTGCGNGSPVNMADNATHGFFYSNLKDTTRTAQNATRTNVYNPTDINTITVSTVTSTTDVVVYDNDYTTYCGYTWDGSGGLYGLTTCVSLNSANECEKHEVRYDNSDLDPASAANREAMACHETGHTVGLLHRNTDTSCIANPFTGARVLSSHDRSHINANY